VRRKQARPSFFGKKEAKKLLRPGAADLSPAGSTPPGPKVFWLLFFKKVTAFFLLSTLPALADPLTIPITQTRLPDGDIRYSVPIRIGNAPTVPALLDTGSTGLHILRAAVFNASYTDTGFASLYEFSAGDRLTGTVGMAVISVGPAPTDAPVPFEIVTQAACAAFRPNCSASLLAPADYGIGGDGIAGQGFQAILGVSLSVDSGAFYTANPLTHIGARQWIIHLPEPGQNADGALTLNPDSTALQGFTMFKLAPEPDGGWLDALPGCLNNLSTGQQICGPSILDTGSPGIIADQPGAATGPLWTQNDQARLSFTSNSGAPSLSFTTNRNPGTGILQEPSQGNATRLVDGFLPFFYFDVLYDSANGEIGLRPRNDAPNTIAADTDSSQSPVEVIQLNAPSPAAPKLPVVITPTQ
jgi:hypothetical protein